MAILGRGGGGTLEGLSEGVLHVNEALDVSGGESVLYAWAVVVEVIYGEGAFGWGVVGNAAESDCVVGPVEDVDVLAGVVRHELLLCDACGVDLGMGGGGRDDFGFVMRGGLNNGCVASWGYMDGGVDAAAEVADHVAKCVRVFLLVSNGARTP